jgi:hypothetical protein
MRYSNRNILYFVFLVSWGGVRLSPLYCGHYWPTVPAPDDRWWVWSSRWNDNWQGNRSTQRKPAPVPFVHHKSHLTSPGLGQPLTAWAKIFSVPREKFWGRCFPLGLTRIHQHPSKLIIHCDSHIRRYTVRYTDTVSKQWFSTVVRPRPGKLFFYKTRFQVPGRGPGGWGTLS